MGAAGETQSTNATDNEGDLHRTTRMFSLTEQASSLESHGKGSNVGEEREGDFN